MKSFRTLSLVLLSLFILSSANANEFRIQYYNLTDSIPALEKDVSSIDGIIAALYDVISGAAGEKRNWDRMRTLFIPELVEP